MFAWFPNLAGIATIALNEIHADFNKHHKESLHPLGKSTIICGENYRQK